MSDDLETLNRRLAEAQLREQQLRTKLASAEVAHAAALEERRSLLVDGQMGDSQTLNSLDRTVIETERAIAALVDALKLAGERTAEAQRQVNDARDQAQREAEAARVRTLVADIDKAVRPLSKSLAACEQALRAAGPICPEALAAAGLVRSMQNDLQAITQQAVSDLKSYCAAIERGGKLRQTIDTTPMPKSRAQKPAMRRVYFIENARWIMADLITTARRYSTHDVPEALATKAIATGIALDPRDETAGKLRSNFGDAVALPADPRSCVDLDRLDPGIDLRRLSVQVVLAQHAKAAKAATAA